MVKILEQSRSLLYILLEKNKQQFMHNLLIIMKMLCEVKQQNAPRPYLVLNKKFYYFVACNSRAKQSTISTV